MSVSASASPANRSRWGVTVGSSRVGGTACARNSSQITNRMLGRRCAIAGATVARLRVG